MRIKHWQGYGSIDAKVTFRITNSRDRYKQVVVEVKGNHEYGLENEYSAIEWLNKVIKDKDLLDNRYHAKVNFNYLPSVRENNCDVERGEYTICFNY